MTLQQPGEERYSLLDANILHKLEDRTFFVEAMDAFYQATANRWGCEVTMSERRLGDVYDCWVDDARRTRLLGFREPTAPDSKPAEPVKLDHFKVASIVAFWLRRACPINSTDPLGIEFSGEALRDFSIDCDRDLFSDIDENQAHYLDLGNELTALLAGFQIVLGGEISLYDSQPSEPGQRKKAGDRNGILSQISLSDTFLLEYPKLFKTKNISWHAIFMNYHSLFERLDIVHGGPSRRERPAARP